MRSNTEISETWQKVEVEVADPFAPYVIITSPAYGSVFDRSSPDGAGILESRAQ